ncbi:hypothetical protein ACS0TY_013520 [Phlomoides rotata]
MMIAFVRKNLPFLISKHSSLACPVSLSLYHPHSFCTSIEGKIPDKSHILFDVLRQKFELSPDISPRVASELSQGKNLENAELILSFLKESGFSNTQLEKILKYKPRVLSNSLEDSIKPKFKIFQDLGFTCDEISKLFTSNPAILQLSLDNSLIPSINLLRGLLRSDDELASLIKRSTWSLTGKLEKTLLPNVEFLKSCGVPMDRIQIVLNSFPNVFLRKQEIIRKSVEKVNEMGIKASSQAFIYAIPAIAGMSNEVLEIKLQAYRDLGFSDSDILTMFRKAPHAFSGSFEKAKKIIELLLATGRFDMPCIVNYPKALASSIENRYMPRLRILGILESRNLISDWPSLPALSMLPDDEFLKKFVIPYFDQVSDVYITESLEIKRRASVESTKMEIKPPKASLRSIKMEIKPKASVGKKTPKWSASR